MVSDYTRRVYNYKNVLLLDCTNYLQFYSTLELKYYKYEEQFKNFLKFYSTLGSKYYQNVESITDYLKLTDTLNEKYYKY